MPLLTQFEEVSAQSSGVPNNPTTFLSEAELDEIKQRVSRGEQPQKQAYDRLLAKANSFLSYSARSVTSNGGGNALRSSQQDTADYNNARSMSEAIYNLSMAYRLSGQDRYAQKALELIDHWTLKDSTFMTSNMGDTPVTGRLRVYITMPSIVYGGDLIWGYGGWTQGQRSEFSDWVRTLGRTAIQVPVDNYKHPDGTVGSKNNKESWRQVMVAVAGGFLEDQSMLDHAFQRFRDQLPSDIGAPGTQYAGLMLKERTRTVPKGGLFYSNYGIAAMTLVAEVAWQHGEDLYNYRAKNVSLKYAADTNVKFALNPNLWKFNNTIGVDAKLFAWYELFYKRTGDPDYLSVINKYKRPMTLDYGIRGNVTVGHIRDNNDTNTPNDPNDSGGGSETPPPSTDDGSNDDTPAPTPEPTPTPQPTPDGDGEPVEGPVIGITRRSEPCRPLSEALSNTFGTAEFSVDIPQSGRYTVWSRIWAPDNAVNSYWMSIDNGYEETCNIVVGDNGSLIPAREWTWVDWHRDRDRTPKEQPFIVDFPNPGRYSFEVAGREGPLRLDKVLFLADDCVPEGNGDNCQVRGDVEAPILSMDTEDGATVSGTLPVTVSVEDENNLEEVSLSVDGTEVASQDGESGDYSFSVDTTRLSDGLRTLTAEATDEDENTSTVSVTVKVANVVDSGDDDGPVSGGDDNNDGSDQDDGSNDQPSDSNDDIVSQLDCSQTQAYTCSTFDSSSELGRVFQTPIPSSAWNANNNAVELANPANQGSGNANLVVTKQWVRGDQVIEVDAKVDDGDKRWQDFSVVFNYQNSNKYYYASFNTENDGNTHGIFKVQNGNVEEIADFGSTIEQGRSYNIRIERQGGSTIVVYRDGVVVGSVTDSSFKNGRVGFGSRNNKAVFDNLVVKRETVQNQEEPEETTPAASPAQVSGLYKARSGANRNKLRWSASSDVDGQVTTYRVYRSVNGGSFSLLGSTPNLVWYDKTIQSNTTYSYYVTAIDDDMNESFPSETLTIRVNNISSLDTRSPLAELAMGAVLNTIRKES